MSENQNEVQEVVEEAVEKKAAPKAKKVAKKAAKKAAKKGTKKAAKERKPRESKASKWLMPVAKCLAKHPDGMTRQQLWERLKADNLGGVLIKRTDLFKSEKHEDERGLVFKLTAAGKKLAAGG